MSAGISKSYIKPENLDNLKALCLLLLTFPWSGDAGYGMERLRLSAETEFLPKTFRGHAPRWTPYLIVGSDIRATINTANGSAFGI